MHNVMMIKRQLVLCLIATLLVSLFSSGCSSTQRIDTDDPDSSYQEFEEKLTDQEVKVSLGDGTSQQAQNLKLNANSTSWTSDGTGEEMSISTSDVWRLQTTSHGKGAWRGLGLGILVGGGLGALSYGAQDDEISAAAGAVSSVVAGVLIGLLIGSIVGYTTTYEINPELAPAPPAQRGSRYQ